MAQLKDTTITGGLSVSGTVNITGATQTNDDVTLYKSSGDSPSIIFQRGTSTDTLNDYKITDSGGYLKIKQQGNGSTSGFTQVAELTNQGTFTVSTPPATDTTPSVSAWISPTDSSVKISTDATIASGDKLVIRDSSDSNKMRSSSISFGTSTSTYLRNDGTWGTPSGGGGGGGSYTATAPIDITSDVISHNDSGVTAATYNMSQNTTTGNIYIPQFTVDAKGHITAASENTDYIPVMSSSTNYSGLLSKDDYNKISNYLGLESPHFVCNGSSGGSYSFSTYNGTTTDAGYGVVSVTISLPYYTQTSNDIGLSNAYITPQIVDVYFRRSTTRTSWYNDGDAYIQASGYQRIDFDWICTSFSYNSASLTWQATLYIYYDPSLAGTKTSYDFWPVIKGYSGK